MGEVGYVILGIKSVSDVRIGDTITTAKDPAKEALPGFVEIKPIPSFFICFSASPERVHFRIEIRLDSFHQRLLFARADEHLGAMFQQTAGNRVANATAATGYQRGLILEQVIGKHGRSG